MTAYARSVAAIVVAYHSAAALDDCLGGLAGAVEMLVVDNSSSAEVLGVAHRYHAGYVDSGSNLGFAAGVNIGLDHFGQGEPRDLLLLNPDAVLFPQDLEWLSKFLHRSGHDRVGAVAPRLLGPSGAEERVVWPFPTPWGAWIEAIGLGRVAAPRARRSFAIGAALLLRAEAVEQVGRFDERFFLYAEEADWQRRALAAGWTTALCPQAVARHAGAGTSSDPLRREALFHAGTEIYVRKWYGPLGWQLYRIAACLGAAGRALVLRGDRRAQAARRALLYLRGPRRSAATVGD